MPAVCSSTKIKWAPASLHGRGGCVNAQLRASPSQVHFLGKAFYGLALVLNSTLLVLAAFVPGRPRTATRGSGAD